MAQRPPSSPVLAMVFFSTCLFLLTTVGALLQSMLGLPGVVVSHVLFFVGMAVAFAAWFEPFAIDQSLRDRFRLRPLSMNGVGKSILIGLLAWALAQTLMFLLLFLVDKLGGKMTQPYQSLTDAPFLLALIVGSVVPAICEELAFRGYILGGLLPLGPRTAILVSGLLFGVMHLTLIRVIPLVMLGVVFASVVQRSGSVLTSMIMHFVNNATALTLTFLLKGVGGAQAEAPPEPTLSTILFLLVAAVGLGTAVWAMVRSFGPGDLASPPAGALSEESPRHSPRGWVLLSLPLVPGLLIYGLAISYELNQVFK